MNQKIKALVLLVLFASILPGYGKTFTLEDLKKLRNEVEEAQSTPAEECAPDCGLGLSYVEEKLGMSNKGICVDLCWNGQENIIYTGNEDCVQFTGGICRYDKKIGRKMYAITVEYSTWEAVSDAVSIDWEEIDEKAEDSSTKDPDPDMDGICSPWISQKGYQDHFKDVCDGTDECPEESEDYDGYRDGDGCADPDNDSDGVCDPWVSHVVGAMDEYGALCDGVDKCPDQAGSVDADGCPDKVLQPPPKFFVLEGVNFESGKATITRDSYSSLMKIVDIMETFKEVTFEIVGHTDNLGSKEKNRRLSADRAAAVKDFLVKNGISSSRIETYGKGGSQPVASNKTSEGRAQNRRIEFIRTDVH